MLTPTSNTITSSRSQPIHYLSIGPDTGPLLIFVHGWPDFSLTWLPQLTNFALLGYHCIAADTCGYGSSHISRTISDYSCESLVSDQLDLLTHLNHTKAIWIGHDWGSGIVWSLAAVHPEKCVAVANLCIPYGILERGLEGLISSVNRDIYPEDSYPYGQWDYQVAYERTPDQITAQFDSDVDKVLKLFHSKYDKTSFGKPARTSTVTKDGGWFGGLSGDKLPDIPLSATVFAAPQLQPIHAAQVASLKKNGFWGATAYYRNHKANAAYNAKAPNDGVLEFPVLFIDAKYDLVVASNEGIARKDDRNPVVGMRKLCKDLTEVTIEAGHWVGLEKYEETNAAIAEWLMKKVEGWPGPKVNKL